ncbi:hypothetical protein [Halobacillus salinus]|uniref:Uncharacterized protein n=1 Tax=Halobacillus salinus TaxID=192814 RepID=A0A4Z0H438_9BACI|nr:hypothetical protein [Halobacillus salinus]TGB05188.1 hypothetical protein E4663_09420 [Halobacillus salinus]
MTDSYNDIDLRDFLNKLTDKTRDKEVQWNKVLHKNYNKLLDRSISEGSIKDAYYTDSSTGGRVVIGKYKSRYYIDEDEFVYEDNYFVTLTDESYDTVISFLEGDGDNPLGFSYNLIVSKLHRIITLKANNVEFRINNWFD